MSLLDMQARKDTIIAGGYVSNAGVQVATTGWNGAGVIMAPGAGISYQAVVIPAAATAINAPPSVGQCEVDNVEGSLFLQSPTVAGIYVIGCGIYISKYDTRTGTWGVRSSTNAASDAARDDWLMLKAFTVTLPLPAAVTDPMVLEIKLGLPHPILLGGGEALHVGIENNSGSVGSITVSPYFRSRVSNVV